MFVSVEDLRLNMFSLNAPTGSSTATRNPKRRQRTISDDSVALRPCTKRQKRSLLAPDTFAPLSNKQSNGHALHHNGQAVSNVHLSATRKQRDVSVDTTSLAIRNRTSKRVGGEKRSTRLEDGVVQVAFLASRCKLDVWFDLSFFRPEMTTISCCKIRTSRINYERFSAKVDLRILVQTGMF